MVGSNDRAKSSTNAADNSFRVGVEIRATQVEDIGDGRFVIWLPGRVLTTEESNLLEQLFPTMFGKVERLLSAEALIAAVIDR